MKTRGQIRNVEGRRDISDGKETLPIRVKCSSKIPLPQFQYIKNHSTSNAFVIPDDRLKKIKGCNCENGRCDSSGCDCVGYSKEIKEILECGDNCGCFENCGNRRFANAISPSLYLKYRPSIQGFGVFARKEILKNSYIASYVGEICEVRAHTELPDSDYIFSIESKVSGRNVEIDATRKGNISRFFNHSCNPNLKMKIVYFGIYRMPYPTFFTKRKIQRKEELTIDYGSQYFSNKGLSCKCGECDSNRLI